MVGFTPLSTTAETIDRSIFKAIINECVKHGYTPDITTINVNNPQDYKAALVSIRSHMGFAIEVFGVGSSQSKQMKRIPRIVVTKQNVLPGDLGGDPTADHQVDPDDPTKFRAKVRPPQTSDYYYAIDLITNTAKQMRILNSILALALPKRGYIPIYNDTSNLFFLKNVGFQEYNDSTEGIEEHRFIYHVPDVFETEDNVVRVNIVPISEITVTPKVGIDFDHTVDGPVKPIVP